MYILAKVVWSVDIFMLCFIYLQILLFEKKICILIIGMNVEMKWCSAALISNYRKKKNIKHYPLWRLYISITTFWPSNVVFEIQKCGWHAVGSHCSHSFNKTSIERHVVFLFAVVISLTQMNTMQQSHVRRKDYINYNVLQCCEMLQILLHLQYSHNSIAFLTVILLNDEKIIWYCILHIHRTCWWIIQVLFNVSITLS